MKSYHLTINEIYINQFLGQMLNAYKLLNCVLPDKILVNLPDTYEGVPVEINRTKIASSGAGGSDPVVIISGDPDLN